MPLNKKREFSKQKNNRPDHIYLMHLEKQYGAVCSETTRFVKKD